MFEISFAEMMVVAVVALLVIGPQKLPQVARTLGHLLGRAQRYVNGVKSDIARDMNMAELNRLQENIKQEFNKAQELLNKTTVDVNEQVRQINDTVTQTVQQVVNADTPLESTTELETATTLKSAANLESRPESETVSASPQSPIIDIPAPQIKPSRQVATIPPWKRTPPPKTTVAETPLAAISIPPATADNTHPAAKIPQQTSLELSANKELRS